MGVTVVGTVEKLAEPARYDSVVVLVMECAV